ncbi:cenp-O kinetochore centromere component [Colletotrichum karsti]|uniref:Cenp-O kinetochore centromere component n=1 Tax=Colletotrichum karsti TaxID=1095194 RepID=A0A9P6LNA5_9PEZI|nr:cenp-O kinetochore centromere component [Colletotrichum karsti]KAF9879330.1 cenp-O kinetochore centromere component [Colletotrichum karsti]
MSAEPQDAVAEALKTDIEGLKKRVASLKKDLKIQATALLSSESTRKALEEKDNNRHTIALPTQPNPTRDKVAWRSKAQAAHDQQCLYRTCATITTFKIQDPDPNAVDRGNVLGIRIELMSNGAFKRPFYVMLNRPYKGSRHLRVHRHTVPAAIPLAALAARYLAPPKAPDAENQTTQDLSRFVRMLRREIIRYHNRVEVIRDLQKAAVASRGDRPEDAIVSIGAANTEATQISLEWADSKAGRLVMSEDGQIQKIIVLNGEGRDREFSRELIGDSRRVEDVLKRLPSIRG